MSNTTPTRTVHTSSGGGIGCLGIAALISIVLGVLKVAGVLELSWLLVLAPTLVTFGLIGVGLLIVLIGFAIGALILAGRGRR